MPRIDVQGLGRLLRLNQAAARGYMEQRIVELYQKLTEIQTSFVSELKQSFDPANQIGMLIPDEIILMLFYPGSRYRDSVKLVDLDTLSFEELVARVDRLEQLVREFHFFKLPVKRKLELEDSFRLLRVIMKSRKSG